MFERMGREYPLEGTRQELAGRVGLFISALHACSVAACVRFAVGLCEGGDEPVRLPPDRRALRSVQPREAAPLHAGARMPGKPLLVA